MPYSYTFYKNYKYDSGQQGITVPVRFLKGETPVELLAKIDTGADFCIFQREYGELLDLVIENGDRKSFSTAAGSFDAFGHEVTMSILDVVFTLKVYFAQSSSHSRNVLGRNGWLPQIRLCIIDHDCQMYMSHYNDSE